MQADTLQSELGLLRLQSIAFSDFQVLTRGLVTDSCLCRCQDGGTEANEIKPGRPAVPALAAAKKMYDTADEYLQQLVQQPSCPAPEAADQAAGAAACFKPAPGTSLSSANKIVAGSGGHRFPHSHDDPSPLGGSPVSAEGQTLPLQGTSHGAHAAEPVTPAPHAAPANVSVSMCDAPMGGMVGSGEAKTIGKRKQARKSTRTVLESAASAQHSTAVEADADVSPVVDVKPINLDSSSGSAGARTAPPHEVIDLT